jgi:hypothetical protein
MTQSANQDTFFTMSGCSPPSGDGQTPTIPEVAPPTGEAPVLPPQLIEELSALLASALVADIRQYPNFAEIQQNLEGTVEARRGLAVHRRLK